MKIQKIVLKDVEVIEEDGDFKKVYKNEKAHPAFLTNYALKKGKENGYIESSLFSDLLKMQGLEKFSTNPDEMDPAVLEGLDETKMLRVIYLAFLGANKSSSLSLDEFLEKYHNSLDETMELYMNLIMDLMDTDPNKFAHGLSKSTNKSGKKKK